MIQKEQKLYLCFMLLIALLVSSCETAVKTDATRIPSPVASATRLTENPNPS